MSFSSLSDEQLQSGQALVILACSRSKSSLRKKREQWFCYFGRALKVEADLRGLPAVGPQVRASQADVGPPIA